MAYGDYYNPTNKIVNSGDIVYADDINSINTAVDAGFAQVATDLDVLSVGSAAISQAWAVADRGTRPDILLDQYSAKANALEAQDWAVAVGTITEAKTGLPLAGSKSAKTSAAEASSSASSASGSASTATTQAGIATTQAGLADGYRSTASGHATTATTQAGIATTKATEAQDWASKAVDSIVSGGKYSAYHYSVKTSDMIAALGNSITSIGALTPAADRIPYYTGASTAALATFTAAGRAVVGAVDSAAQRTAIGLGNVPNLDCTNGTNITSGTVADARIAATISRDNAVGTAVQTALNLKANISSPTFTGTPASVTATVNTNTTQIATTQFVLGQVGTAVPLMNGTATVGTSYLYSREDHRHGSDTAKANLASPSLTGVPLAPTASPGTNTTQIATTAYADAIAALKSNIASPTFTGVPAAPTASAGTNTTQLATTAFVTTADNLKANKTLLDSGGIIVPSGTTAERPSVATKHIRYNSDLNGFEGSNGTAWGSLGGGATGGGSDKVFVENDMIVTASYTITSGKSASSTGPVTVNNGVVITIPDGSRWVIL